MSKNKQHNLPNQLPPQIKEDSLPLEAKIVRNLLKEMDIHDYEPHVITQILDFAYNYTADILTTSQQLSAHANHSKIELSDVKLACDIKFQQEERKNVKLPSNFKLNEYAKNINSKNLKPVINNNKLPADRYCVHTANYEKRDIKEVSKYVEEGKKMEGNLDNKRARMGEF